LVWFWQIIAKAILYPIMKILNLAVLLCLQINVFSIGILPEFSAVYSARKKAIITKWQHLSSDVKTYLIQRSINGKLWVDIALQEVDRSGESRFFNFEDKNATAGKNDYRLKCIYKDGKIVYSMIVTVMIGSLADSWVMYPVPVTDLLNLDYRGTELIKGVINVIIQHPTGKIFIKQRYSSLSRQIKIPVNNVPKGIYDIRIIVKDEVIWDQRFIK
jgi:hypothetical protein